MTFVIRALKERNTHTITSTSCRMQDRIGRGISAGLDIVGEVGIPLGLASSFESPGHQHLATFNEVTGFLSRDGSVDLDKVQSNVVPFLVIDDDATRGGSMPAKQSNTYEVIIKDAGRLKHKKVIAPNETSC